jgi:DNA topoisomerase-2
MLKLEKSVTQFLDQEYVEYAMYVIEQRAIPSIIDGLKPTQRKILYSCNKIWGNSSGKAMKVFQLAGKTSSDTFYHHGDMSGSIINLAQDFKNNLPLLERDGQFGDLRSPEAGAPRYIGVSLSKNFKKIYKDFELLTPQYEEGNEIEPNWFLPVIPLVLVNGANGIAVGYNTIILTRNVNDIIKACLNWLDGKKIPTTITPSLEVFRGKYYQDKEIENKWYAEGIFERLNTSTVQITELPPSMTFENFEKHLEKLIDKKDIVDYIDQSKDSPDYTIKFTRERLASVNDIELKKMLKLVDSETEFYNTLDEYGKLKIFKNVKEIIEYFMTFRLGFYQKRKDFIINALQKDVILLSNRSRFIKMIIYDELIINKKAKEKLVQELTKEKFELVDDSYDYLLRMAIGNLTKELYEKMLQDEKDKKIELIETKKLKPEEMFKQDLLQLQQDILKK